MNEEPDRTIGEAFAIALRESEDRAMAELLQEQPADKPPKLSGAQRRKLLKTPIRFVPIKPRPVKPKVPPARPRVLTGDYGANDYVQLRAAYRAHKRVSLQGTCYRVLAIQVAPGPNGKVFRATVQEVRNAHA
jgi:hypothetical protein